MPKLFRSTLPIFTFCWVYRRQVCQFKQKLVRNRQWSSQRGYLHWLRSVYIFPLGILRNCREKHCKFFIIFLLRLQSKTRSSSLQYCLDRYLLAWTHPRPLRSQESFKWLFSRLGIYLPLYSLSFFSQEGNLYL